MTTYGRSAMSTERSCLLGWTACSCTCRAMANKDGGWAKRAAAPEGEIGGSHSGTRQPSFPFGSGNGTWKGS